MAIASAPAPAERAVGAAPAARDASIDAVRSLLLVVVVALHAMMVGVSVGATGPVLRNALENQEWFAPVSWVVQIMPLFFVIGGFAGITQWRRMRGRGSSAADYVRGRVVRLVRPAIALVAVVGAALMAMAVLGVPADIVATAGFRIGQPLWFLGVYVLCSALVPVATRAHERAPRAILLLLAAAVIAVDALRMTLDLDAVGFVNLLFVWLLVQQFGFWLADGAIDALARRIRVAVLIAALAALALLTAGPYSPDMLVNLNPPTLCLVLLGTAQLMAFSLARRRIAVLAQHPLADRVVGALGERGMTVYLWHMPVLIALAAGLLVLNAAGVPLPEPLSPAWWAGRPLWLLCVALAVAPVAALFARFERGRPAAAQCTTPRSAALDSLLGAGGVAIVLVAGFGVLPAGAALALLVVALVGSGRLREALGGSTQRMTRVGTLG